MYRWKRCCEIKQEVSCILSYLEIGVSFNSNSISLRVFLNLLNMENNNGGILREM